MAVTDRPSRGTLEQQPGPVQSSGVTGPSLCPGCWGLESRCSAKKKTTHGSSAVTCKAQIGTVRSHPPSTASLSLIQQRPNSSLCSWLWAGFSSVWFTQSAVAGRHKQLQEAAQVPQHRWCCRHSAHPLLCVIGGCLMALISLPAARSLPSGDQHCSFLVVLLSAPSLPLTLALAPVCKWATSPRGPAPVCAVSVALGSPLAPGQQCGCTNSPKGALETQVWVYSSLLVSA